MSLVLLLACATRPAANSPSPDPSQTPSASTTPSSAPHAEAEREPGEGPSAVPLEGTPAPLPKGTRVLQIGDSFADALGGSLGKMLRAVEVRSDLEFETPSYIPNWSYGAKLPKLLSRYHPDLVLITLGANEIEIPHPEERIKPVKHLVQTLAGRPCVWIAPPLWKPD
ncbi:MAG TPA: hypothetical protein VGC79_24645, partial [Polyangiaceae bacterium]